MGNGNGRTSSPGAAEAIIKTAEARADQLVEWYLEDKEGEEARDPGAVRAARLWSAGPPGGRAAGAAALDKLTDGHGWAAGLAAALPACAACAVGLVAGQAHADLVALAGGGLSYPGGDHASRVEDLAAFCGFVRAEWGPDNARPLFGELGARVSARSLELGLHLQSAVPSAALVRNWADWAVLHLVVRAAEEIVEGEADGGAGLARLAGQYLSDLEALAEGAAAAAGSATRLELGESSYYTFPVDGQKRWWVDATVKVVERTGWVGTRRVFQPVE